MTNEQIFLVLLGMMVMSVWGMWVGFGMGLRSLAELHLMREISKQRNDHEAMKRAEGLLDNVYKDVLAKNHKLRT